jgi:arylsulfatase
MADITSPNILFILADQLRADFLSCYGADYIETPNIDSIAANGILYKRAVSPSPLCVPARASLLTGLNAIRNGVLNNACWLRPDKEQMGIKTWPQKLYESGYYTSAIGKMHFYPWDIKEGFEHRIIAEDKRHLYVKDDYADYLGRHGLHKLHGKEHKGYYDNKGAVISLIPEEHQVDRWVAEQTARFIKNYSEDKPFAVMVGFPGPHCPYDPPQCYADLFDLAAMPVALPRSEHTRKLQENFIKGSKQPWNGVDYTEFTDQHIARIRAYYAGLVKQIDDGVGTIIESLKKSGVYKNTVIIFTSDHGDLMGDFGMVGKGNFLEGSIRVPLIISHPSQRKAGTVMDTVSLTDLHATILSLSGVQLMNATQSSSTDMVENGGFSIVDSAVLPGLPGSTTKARDHVFGCIGGNFAVIDNKCKFARYRSGEVHLFNLKDDPDELNNLANDPVWAEQVMRYDRIISAEIADSLAGADVFTANSDKKIDKFADISPTEFGERGWMRIYPAKS